MYSNIYLKEYMIQVKYGKLKEVENFLTDFFGTKDEEIGIFGDYWKTRKADDKNLLVLLTQYPVIYIYTSERLFAHIQKYLVNTGKVV